ncbi:hypothetical protein OO007_19790 [Cocleimonas sp. KMM 6892]|uniref:hypothetical protein n=1 Tax=unclassified Cocleimonas TaxID=2639732 RepID=UPI002DB5D3C9|nr:MULTISPECIES: hypothetical protein [unclassified Cocleimonas]MEB8434490.1 hypothetical protein [Cocleimonas sp. KMM 6892]MEC4717383.1 hypothetical protein [Cocleimonas sp. KMM 6895]MEC4746762.1 hypothetical protein [Cocleimonas sp. KMM 6896]
MDQYLKLAKLADSVVYEDSKSVQGSNSAVNSMYSIVRDAGEDDLMSLITLLENSAAKKWLAHQLVELHSLPKDVEDKCFNIVQELANKDSLNAVGEQLWLEEWKSKLGRA